jgi:hypothetical protein
MTKRQSSSGTHSAVYGWLRQLCEDLRSQSTLVAHITQEDCERWREDVISESVDSSDLPIEYDSEYLHRFLKKPDVAASQFYLSFVHYFILRLTSILELYLKDSLKQYMKLNYDL